MSTFRKKLIEVALPLEEINVASAREKSIRYGHPSTIHLWWARRPLATCRAVLFSSIIDDPGEAGVPKPLLDAIDQLPLAHKYRHLAVEDPLAKDGNRLPPDELEHERTARQRRYRLFTFLERLIQWDNSNDEETLRTARHLISAATNGEPPPVLDPFCGGGSIPLEGQRLGLEVFASDINPVAVLITKALTEIPTRFLGVPPVNPVSRDNGLGIWTTTQGLAEDVRYYGQIVQLEAEQQLKHLYPKVTTAEGRSEEVIAWLWARTAPCPNPACGSSVPLVRSFILGSKPGKERWLVPSIDRSSTPPQISFIVACGESTAAEKRAAESGTAIIVDTDPKGRVLKRPKKLKATFKCPACGIGILKGAEIDEQAKLSSLAIVPLAVVSEGKRGRTYTPFDSLQIEVAALASDDLGRIAMEAIPHEPCRGTFASNAQGRVYGFKSFRDYFTDRQLVSLTCFSKLITEVREQVEADSEERFNQEDRRAYSAAVVTYLAFSLSRLLDRATTLCTWDNSSKMEAINHAFARQGISITWDFAEGSPFSSSSGNWISNVNWVARSLERVGLGPSSTTSKQDASHLVKSPASALISTDPPYFDNMSYADLSDFFYVWLRRCVGDLYPQLFDTVLTPKLGELIAAPERFGGSKSDAGNYFREGFRAVFQRLGQIANPNFPLTIYYAFKQAEDKEDSGGNGSSQLSVSTGWETMLQGLCDAGFSINGTWPTRSELGNRVVAMGTNALTSCIVLACRRRQGSLTITRREFQSYLRSELGLALAKLQQGNILPVDLAQAAIGPGMSIFSRYAAILESDGTAMTVATALGLINQALDEALEEQEGWYDGQTRWAVIWFAQRGFEEGPYGEAETLATAKDAPVKTMVEAEIIASGGGRVKLFSRTELPAEYDPAGKRRITIWEVTQYLVRALDEHGELGAARMLRRFREAKPDVDVDRARELAYRLYAICDRKRWTQEARGYNALVLSWTDIEAVSQTDNANWLGSSASSNLFSGVVD